MRVTEVVTYFQVKKILTLSLIAILCTAFYTGAPTPREKHRVRMIIQYGNKGTADTTAYFYNAEGHISYTQNAHTGVFGSRYHYLPGLILRQYHDYMKDKNYTDTLLLNAAGLVERVKSNNTGLIYLHHQYNADKQLIKSFYVDAKGVEQLQSSYEYQNGNRTTITSFITSGRPVCVNTYKFYQETENTIGNENLGADFAGADSKNPEKYHSFQFAGEKPESYKSIYHYDDKGRISIKATYNVTSGKLSDSIAYIYYSGGVRLVIDRK
jgi:hypothetical protein